MNREYRTIPAAEVAKLLKKRLDVVFPGVRFSVTSSTYSGYYSSVIVRWTDGPTHDEVWPIAQSYSGHMFDSLIDFGYYVYHWLLPDGGVQPAYSPGTLGQLGSDPPYDHPQPYPDAELVLLRCSVEVSRTLSDKLLADALELYEKEHGQTRMRVVPARQSGKWTVAASITGGSFDEEMDVYDLARKISRVWLDFKQE